MGGGGGVDSPARRESVSPSPRPVPDPRSSPARPRLPGFPASRLLRFLEGRAERKRRGVRAGRRAGVDRVENSAPAHTRESESIPSAASRRRAHHRHTYTLALSRAGWISKFVTGFARPPRDLRLRRAGAAGRGGGERRGKG